MLDQQCRGRAIRDQVFAAAPTPLKERHVRANNPRRAAISLRHLKIVNGRGGGQADPALVQPYFVASSRSSRPGRRFGHFFFVAPYAATISCSFCGVVLTCVFPGASSDS